MFDAQLRRVINVLILATAACAVIFAFRRDTFRRSRDDAQQFRTRKILFNLGDFGLNCFADDHERHEDDEFFNSPDAFAAKCNVVDRYRNPVANFERHAGSLKNKTRAKSLFVAKWENCLWLGSYGWG